MTKESENAGQKIIDENAAESATEETKESSAFSEDGMETEIEVDPEDSAENARKKRKKKKEKEANISSTDTSSTAEEGRVSVSSERDLKRRPSQTKVSYLDKVKGSTPLLIVVAVKIAIFIPIAVYACDIIISLNVLENGLQYVNNLDKNNISELDRNALLAEYTHPHRNSIMNRVEYWIRQRSKRDINGTDNFNSTFNETTAATLDFDITTDFSLLASQVPTVLNEATSQINIDMATADIVGTTSPSLTSQSITSDSTVGNEETTVNSTTTMYTTTTEPPPEFYMIEGEFCYNLRYFVNLHKTYNEEHKLDWYDTVYTSLRKYQKALFYMFTIGGFVFLMMAIVMRCEIFINQSWSSYLLLTFIMYMISTSLTAHVFAVQSGYGGLRCFLCRVTSYCQGVEPWNLQSEEYFPHDSLNWTLVVLISFVFKLYDCFMMGLVTLWIIHDVNDPWYASLIKFGGWLVIFPLMVFTPLFGVIIYDVLPVTVEDSSPAYLGFSIVFWLGVVFWAISLIILPILCKAKMCSEGEEYYDDETEEYTR